MGNEMGNNNTSGFQEEDKSTNETRGKSPEESVNNVNDAKGEHEVAPVAESKDYRDQGSGLDSDDQNKVIDDQAHSLRADGGRNETEVLPPVESPKAETRDEAGSEDAELQPSFSLGKLTDREEPSKSYMVESELRKLDSSKKAEEDVMSDSTLDMISLSDHAEPHHESLQLKLDQEEVSEVYGDQLEEDIADSNLQTGIEIIPGSCIAVCAIAENDPPLETYISAGQDELDVFLDALSTKDMPSEDNTPSEEKSEAGEGYEVANGLSKTSTSDILTDAIVTDCHELDEVTTRLGNDSSVPVSQAKLIHAPISSKADVSLVGRNSIVPTEETALPGENSGDADRHDPGPNQSTVELATESDTYESNASQTYSSIGTSYTNDKMEAPSVIFYDPDSNGSFPFREAKIREHLNEASEGQSQDYKEETEMFPEFRKIPSDPSILNSKGDTEEPSSYKLKEEEEQDKQAVEVVEENIEASFVSQKTGEEKESQEQHLPLSLPLHAQAYTSIAPASLSQSQDRLHQSVVGFEDARDINESTLELKHDGCLEFFVSEDSNLQATGLTEEDLVPPVELPTGKSQQADDQSSEHRENFDTCVFAGTTGFQLQETAGKLSTYRHKPKSPSFDFDLRIDTRSEESDGTPLLYQGKSTFEPLPSQADRHGGEDLYQYHAMEVEEKVIILERSDSEKSRTPFLGFMKEQEEEEPRVVVVSKKQDNNNATKKATKDLKCSTAMEVSSASSKAEEKHKRRSSLFGSCICCTTAID